MKVGVALPAEEVAGSATTPGWPEIRSFALAAEAAGIDSLWMWDHFFYDPEDGSPVEGVHEAWTLMSAVAAITQRVEIGALVMCVSFRNPGLLAKMAAALDEVSGGRLILGLGAGWHDPEYDAFDIPKDHRVARFEEALQIITPLLEGERVTFDGNYHHAHNAVLLPAPKRHIPILIASEGPRMLRLAARFADSWNTAWFGAPDQRLDGRFAAFEEALKDEGRDPSSVLLTVGVTLREPGQPDDGEPSLWGSAGDIARAFDSYAARGVDHLILGLEPTTERSLELVADALRLRAS
jgi:probable F420-dependent oxidoreductase